MSGDVKGSNDNWRGGQVLVSIIVAVARNGVIGRDGKMPWRLSGDLKRFRALTMGKPVIMGRKTYDSIGKPLDGRGNIVITRNPRFAVTGVRVAHDWPAALAMAGASAKAPGIDEIMVIGGAEIYAQAMARAGRIYLTRVHCRPDGDAVFTDPDPAIWRMVSSQEVPAGDKDDFSSTFMVLEKAPAPR